MTTVWLVGEIADYVFLYFDCGASYCPVQWNKHCVEMRDSCCVKRAITRYVRCSAPLHIDLSAVPFVHRLVTEF